MSDAPHTTDPDLDRFGGLTRSEALRLCVKHSAILTLNEVSFVIKTMKNKRPLRTEEIMQLRHLTLRCQQAAARDAGHASAQPG